MAMNGDNNVEDTEMAECDDGEKVVTMMDVLQEEQDFEDDANAVLGASDEKNCTYSKGYIKRQAIYACLTCCTEAKDDPTKRAGVCLACSLNCHENHELVELYTKRNFRCDCGNPKFNSHPCQFTPDKNEYNDENKYNQNFSGLYCNCHRPYPDPEATNEDEEMIQCIICEDWLHASHLDAVVPGTDQYSEMICKACMESNEFLYDYSTLAVNVETGYVDIITISGSDIKLSNGGLETEKLANGTGDEDIMDKPKSDMDVDAEHTENRSTAESVLTELNQESDKCDEKTEQPENTLIPLSLDVNTDVKEGTDITIAVEGNAKDAKETLECPISNDKESLECSVSEDKEALECSVSEVQETLERPVSENKETLESPVSENNAPLEDPLPEVNETLESPECEDKESASLQESEEKTLPENPEAPKSTDTSEEVEKTEEDKNDTTKSEENSDITNENIVATAVMDQMSETTLENGDEVAKLDSEDSIAKKEEINKTVENDSANEDMDTNHTTVKNDAGEDTEISEKTANNDDNSDSTKATDIENYIRPNGTDIETSEGDKDATIENSDKTLDLDNTNKTETDVETAEADLPANEVTREPEVNDSISKVDSNENMKENTDDGPSENSEVSYKTDNNIEESKDNKRKLCSDNILNDTSAKKLKLDVENSCSRPQGVKRVHKGATFWPSNFRQKLCTCSECLSMYKDLSVLFLVDPEDTVFAYETLGKERVDGRATQYEKGLEALSSLDRVQQINALTEYNKMKDKLLDFLKSFKDRKEIVKEEDIKAFFAGMKPKREPDGVYFCR